MKDVDVLKSKYFSQIDDRDTEGGRQEAMVDILLSIIVMPALVASGDQSVTYHCPSQAAAGMVRN